MNSQLSPAQTVRPGASVPAEPASRFAVNRWLQIFLTIIAGAVVTVIAWTVIERFQHVLILLAASLIVAFLLAPLVNRLETRGVPRILGTLVVLLLVIGGLGLFGTIMLGPLIRQLQDVITTLPKLVSNQNTWLAELDRFFGQNGIPLQTATLQKQLGDYITSASTSLLGGTLTVVSSLVGLVTDLFLILAITFYIVVDGQSMRNNILRLLPARARDRWFFIEATLNSVLGGYIRGQILVALTVGAAAGIGSAVLGVSYPLVIGLLAFLFEFIPLIGPVLGMIPAVIIALFQPFPLVLWVIVFFIALQQVESNLIVPRISGHAVGLHPLAAMLALVAGVEIAGLGGALISVPVVGVLYVIGMALYSDATHQTNILIPHPRRSVYTSLQTILQRRGAPAAPAAAAAPAGTPAPAAPASGISERLTNLAQEQAVLMEKFDAAAADAPSPSDLPPAPLSPAPAANETVK